VFRNEVLGRIFEPKKKT